MRRGQIETMREYDEHGGYFVVGYHICKTCFKRRNMSAPVFSMKHRDYCSDECAEVTT